MSSAKLDLGELTQDLDRFEEDKRAQEEASLRQKREAVEYWERVVQQIHQLAEPTEGREAQNAQARLERIQTFVKENQEQLETLEGMAALEQVLERGVQEFEETISEEEATYTQKLEAIIQRMQDMDENDLTLQLREQLRVALGVRETLRAEASSRKEKAVHTKLKSVMEHLVRLKGCAGDQHRIAERDLAAAESKDTEDPLNDPALQVKVDTEPESYEQYVERKKAEIGEAMEFSCVTRVKNIWWQKLRSRQSRSLGPFIEALESDPRHMLGMDEGTLEKTPGNEIRVLKENIKTLLAGSRVLVAKALQTMGEAIDQAGGSQEEKKQKWDWVAMNVPKKSTGLIGLNWGGKNGVAKVSYPPDYTSPEKGGRVRIDQVYLTLMLEMIKLEEAYDFAEVYMRSQSGEATSDLKRLDTVVSVRQMVEKLQSSDEGAKIEDDPSRGSLFFETVNPIQDTINKLPPAQDEAHIGRIVALGDALLDNGKGIYEGILRLYPGHLRGDGSRDSWVRDSRPKVISRTGPDGVNVHRVYEQTTEEIETARLKIDRDGFRTRMSEVVSGGGKIPGSPATQEAVTAVISAVKGRMVQLEEERDEAVAALRRKEEDVESGESEKQKEIDRLNGEISRAKEKIAEAERRRSEEEDKRKASEGALREQEAQKEKLIARNKTILKTVADALATYEEESGKRGFGTKGRAADALAQALKELKF